MKRQTAVRHLAEVAELATDGMRFRDFPPGWPVEELWVAGDLLEDASSIEASSLILVLDLPPEQLPWLARHPVGEFIDDRLRLPKRPLHWCYRPLAWPAWNHQHRRLVRFWTAATGVEDHVIDGLRSSGRELPGVVAPAPTELADQLQTELTISRRHLRDTVEHYWDRAWRRQHSGYGTFPEDHLWRAASAVEDMQAALDELTDPSTPDSG